MTPTQLHVFVTVAKLGSFSKAASLLNQTRPGVTASIKALEQEFGGALLTRAAGDIKPTLLGKEILVHAVAISREYGQLRQITKTGLSNVDSVLRIAAPNILCCWPLPRLLKSFQLSHPGHSIKLLEAYTAELPRLLAQNLVDVALSTSSVSGWDWSLLLKEPFIALFRHETMVGSNDLSISQLSNVPLIITDGDNELLIEAAFQQTGAILRKSYSASSYAVAFSMVQEGLGVSILPHSIAKLAPATLISIPITDGPSRVIGLIHSMKPGSVVQAFVDGAESSLARLWPNLTGVSAGWAAKSV